MLYILLDNSRDWLDERGLYRYVQVLDQIEFRALAAATLSFLIVLLVGPRVIRFLTRLKVGDAGLSDAEALRQHTASKKNTPTMGGVLIAGSIFLSVFLLADLTRFVVMAGLLVLFWMAVLGGFDDWLKLTAARRGDGRQGLYAWEKLVFQLGVGLIIGWFLSQRTDEIALIRVLNLPFQKTYEAGELAPGVVILPALVFVLISVLMIAGISNAVNITDGMDGLATGISAAVALGLLVLALIAGSEVTAKRLLVPHIPSAEEIGVIAGAMAGACLGFLWWNCAPAKVFMGDTGSLCLGGLIGYMAIVLRQEIVVLLMCGVFLIEIGSVMLQVGYYKKTGGKRIFRCAPIHHHFHLGGWQEQQVVARAWILSIVLIVFALATIKLR